MGWCEKSKEFDERWGVRTTLSCSLIEVEGKFLEFFAIGQSHFLCKDVYLKFKCVIRAHKMGRVCPGWLHCYSYMKPTHFCLGVYYTKFELSLVGLQNMDNIWWLKGYHFESIGCVFSLNVLELAWTHVSIGFLLGGIPVWTSWTVWLGWKANGRQDS